MLSLIVLVMATGCLPSPQQAQTRDLLDQLTQARATLGQNAAMPDACAQVGDAETRLYGEPGLVDVQPAWGELANAAHALQAVCGQGALVAQPGLDSPASRAAQQRWQQGIQRELGVACDHLRAAATALGRNPPC